MSDLIYQKLNAQLERILKNQKVIKQIYEKLDWIIKSLMFNQNQIQLKEIQQHFNSINFQGISKALKNIQKDVSTFQKINCSRQKLQKSNSMKSISNRKHLPVKNISKEKIDQLIDFEQNESYNLINKTKNYIQQISENINNFQDLNTVRFQLDKALSQITQKIQAKCSQSSKDSKKQIINPQSSKSIIQEYFTNQTKISEETSQKSNEKIGSQCSIKNFMTLTSNQTKKERNNFSKKDKYSIPELNSKFKDKNKEVSNQTNSQKNGKYFKRTSNEQKFQLLKMKFKNSSQNF